MKYFATSMMCVDYFDLANQIKIIEKHTDYYHIDIMDAHFVPNLALSFDFIKQLRKHTTKPIDAHLMMTNPVDYLDLLIEMKVDFISFHPQTIEKNVFQIINKLKANNIKFGIVLSPFADIEAIKYYQEHVDKVTVMTVEPGFAGQSVIKEAIGKIKQVKDYRSLNQLNFLIEVDGSNNFSTFSDYYKFGADIFILGSTLFKEKDLDKQYQKIKEFIGNIND
ncbi:MAG: allulose-6-phosphate 3-epimerase [Tenericutes bacterium HGW-Tenericutes-5]|jgi:D-allulose-6-phosphate 3-epimerase|nr:MAG: allulose-6-phosphate 3-epimerase [Tenericutes bacterium HGW-Tenericutes-5]